MSNPPDRIWRHWLRVAEAILLILVARFLVARVRFRHWRSLLGNIAGADEGAPCGVSDAGMAVARRCTHALRRAVARLPGTLCLPQAMALQWMLRRRGVGALLFIGVAGHGARRGRLQDLHAWLEADGMALLDDGSGHHRVLLRFQG